MAQQTEFVDFEVQADFANVKEFGGGGFQLVPPGEYLLDVEHLEQKPSSNNQPMITVTFSVADGQETEESAKCTGQKVFNNYSLQPQAIGRLKMLMIACGAPLDTFRASACLGAKIRATVVHSQGQASTDAEGKPLPARTFANVANERPLEATATEAPPPPPVTKKAAATTTKPAANGATRRA